MGAHFNFAFPLVLLLILFAASFVLCGKTKENSKPLVRNTRILDDSPRFGYFGVSGGTNTTTGGVTDVS